MVYKIIVANTKVFAKDFSKLNKKDQVSLKQKILQLKESGISHAQAKQLHNFTLADYRLRSGNYRLLFDCDLESKGIVLYRVLHRSKLY